MVRSGVGLGSPYHGTPLTGINVAPHLVEHAWPIDSGPHERSGVIRPLVPHVVMKRCEDIQLQGTGKHKLLHCATLWVLQAAIQHSIFQEEERLRLLKSYTTSN